MRFLAFLRQQELKWGDHLNPERKKGPCLSAYSYFFVSSKIKMINPGNDAKRDGHALDNHLGGPTLKPNGVSYAKGLPVQEQTRARKSR